AHANDGGRLVERPPSIPADGFRRSVGSLRQSQVCPKLDRTRLRSLKLISPSPLVSPGHESGPCTTVTWKVSLNVEPHALRSIATYSPAASGDALATSSAGSAVVAMSEPFRIHRTCE